MLPFKDRVKAVTYSKRAEYEARRKELAQAIRGADRAPGTALRDFLFPQAPSYEHHGDHSVCGYRDGSDNGRDTESRLCRCLYFLHSPSESISRPRQEEKCRRCTYPHKPVFRGGGYRLLDYEVAVPCNHKRGIDLVWEGPDGKTYAVEVKPQDSAETILRMVAEIRTYTLFLPEWNGVKLWPAICFFQKREDGTSDSAQWMEYLGEKDQEDFQTILSGIHVFYFTVEHGVHILHDGEKEPICR